MSKLLALDEKRQRARKARIYCEGEVAKHGAGQQMCPYPCGIICMKVSTVPCEIVIFRLWFTIRPDFAIHSNFNIPLLLV